MNNLSILTGIFLICVGISFIVEGIISKIHILNPNEQYITINKQYQIGVSKFVGAKYEEESDVDVSIVTVKKKKIEVEK
jgi:hypothetical protein